LQRYWAAKWSQFHAAIAPSDTRFKRAYEFRGSIMNIARPFKPVDLDKAQDVDVEGHIRDLVRHDSTAHREATADSELAASKLGTLIGRVSGSSAREIDHLIGELRGLRDKLQTDGERVQHDIVEYAALTQSVMQLTKIISDGVTHVKKPDGGAASGSVHRPPIGNAAREI
jgi:hypothetical protein